MNETITVSQLNRYVKSRLDEDRILKDLFLTGEISNLSNHYRSGHIYFVLKDANAAVRAVLFRSYAQQLRFPLQNGMHAVVRGSISLYERDGSYQLYAREVFPEGKGLQWLQFERLKEQLEKEGLFDPALKRPLVPFPKRIGIVTSPTGAALQDMLRILRGRWPLCTVILSPATVQGAEAPRSLLQALERLKQQRCDVVIVGRGGGSSEDLWAFNDELLTRAVRAFPCPVISAVGHETDFTLCDFAADLRAPTPTAAAVASVPDLGEILGTMHRTGELMRARLETRLSELEQRTLRARRQVQALSPAQRLEQAGRRILSLQEQLERRIRWQLQRKEQALQALGSLIDSLSPMKTLARGYSVLLQEGHAVRSAADVSPGESLRAVLYDGELLLKVEKSNLNKPDMKAAE
ncbi:MAG: exodeoxyribonuclease VII large subunit [Provencibacterium sp.]|jgi:exodeoxyribonuclease VII large subunit|nr:exodeoxyribonuclease VII large subunit [Provencibacterium sp.]